MEEEGHHLYTLSTVLNSRDTTFDLVTGLINNGSMDCINGFRLSPSLQPYNCFFSLFFSEHRSLTYAAVGNK